MNTQEQKNYDNPKKRHWRRTIINGIKDRLPVAPKDAVVIYLGGRENLDRELFRDHGFDVRNLICVERIRAVAKQIRNSGELCVHADFFETVWAALESIPAIHVVYGDLSGVITKPVLDNIVCWTKIGKFFKTVFAFNFLRGRDGESSDWFDQMFPREHRLVKPTHRGYLLYKTISGVIVTDWIESGQYNPILQGGMDSAVKKINYELAPFILEYRSESQTFDSLVYRLYGGGTVLFDPTPTDIGLAPYIPTTERLKAKRSLAAFLAHRTMRMK